MFLNYRNSKNILDYPLKIYFQLKSTFDYTIYNTFSDL